jgi:hypothetical protein|tara:strand:- start:439 stop:774 length:336 start_codon:yes stop_codon:yes gene_type:complete
MAKLSGVNYMSNEETNKLAIRLEGLEVKVDIFEKYQTERNHDIMIAISSDQVKSAEDRKRVSDKIDSLEILMREHTSEEQKGLRRVGTWIITGLGAAVIGLLSFIWKGNVG